MGYFFVEKLKKCVGKKYGVFFLYLKNASPYNLVNLFSFNKGEKKQYKL